MVGPSPVTSNGTETTEIEDAEGEGADVETDEDSDAPQSAVSERDERVRVTTPLYMFVHGLDEVC
jgi:hypothetical protein